ncbi:LisH dimerization motif containing protein [Pseudohyphozyma bogoriensis]|nr:LisH dimerization motif containing protein [Pseudohyphozyma bogoriensis]
MFQPSTTSKLSSSTPLTSASKHLHLVPATTPLFSPAQIHQLVQDYLTHEAYPDSAAAFAREAHQLAQSSAEPGSDGPAAGSGGAPDAQGVSVSVSELIGSTASRHERMDGVEATPPPVVFNPDGVEIEEDSVMDDDEEEDEEEEEVERGLRRNGVATNGVKRVASSARTRDDDVAYPLLSLEQLAEIRLRREIKDHILSGRIQPALDLLNTHFPAVLSSSPSPPSTSKPTCTPYSFYVPTPVPSLLPPSTPKPPVPIIGSTFTPQALSIDPFILSLSLQLQSFVELIRTSMAASSAPSTPTSSSAGEEAMASSTSSIASVRTTSIMKAITSSQLLRNKVSLLPAGSIREAWEKECVDVSGLLAYTDLSMCPVRGYLDQSRRETLADLVDAGVLQATKQTPLPLLTLAVRQTTAIYSTLAEWKVPFPPVATKEKKVLRTYPKFELRAYLNEAENGNGGSNGGAVEADGTR